MIVIKPDTSVDTKTAKQNFHEYERTKYNPYGKRESERPPNLNTQFSRSYNFDDRSNERVKTFPEFHADEGYSTDSRSNTSASVGSPSSPLSSSLSSLGTLDSAMNSSTGLHINSQRAPIQKAPVIANGGRYTIPKSPGVAVRKKDFVNEPSDNTSNLEDRLRALTTIEEEDVNFERGNFKTSFNKNPYNSTHSNSNFRDFSSSHYVPNSDYSVSGCFRAVPVSIVSNKATDDNTAQKPFSQQNGDGWKEYRKYFEKDIGIAAHNLDNTRKGKFRNSELDNIPDMDINRQIGTGFSTHAKHLDHRPDQNGNSSYPRTTQPNLQINSTGESVQNRNSLTDRQNLMFSLPDLRYNDSRLRQPSNQSAYQSHSSLQYQPQDSNCYNPQHSGIPQSFSDLSFHDTDLKTVYPQNTFENSDLNDPSMNGNTDEFYSYPDVLLRRANTSLHSDCSFSKRQGDRYSWQPGTLHPDQQEILEMNKLQSVAAERSSLDLGSIPKIQRQIRATSEMCLQASKRHRFASSADIYKLFQGQKRPGFSQTRVQSSGPIPFTESRFNPARHSFHATPTVGKLLSSASVNAVNNRPSSDSKPILRVPLPNADSHVPSPGPLRGDHNILVPQYLRSSMSEARPDVNFDLSHRPPFQRQSSGYSSENELQQIESNAKKKHKHSRDKTENINPTEIHNFQPVNISTDLESNPDIEGRPNKSFDDHVYVNTALIESYNDLNDSNLSSNEEPPPLPPRPPFSAHFQQSTFGSQPQTNPIDNKPQLKHQITQKQVIQLTAKPVTITSHVPRFDSSLPQMNLPKESSIDLYSRSEPQRHIPGSNSSTPMTPLEIAQTLNVPFATNIISDESGERLSTLV